MKHYLLFDAHCSVCAGLARDIRQVVGDRLETLGLYSQPALALMKRACPDGWQRAPYLVTEDNGRVQAWTGPAALVQMARRFGPRVAWRIAALARRQGVFLLPAPVSGSRRRLFRTATVATVALAAWLGLRPARTAHATWPPCCEGSYNQCYTHYFCANNYCWGGSRDYLKKVDCYDVRAECMTLCSQVVTIQCCNCC